MIGVALGLISGYYGGRIDAVIQRVIDTLLAFPYLILATALVGVLGPGLRNIVLALLYKEWVYPCRVVRRCRQPRSRNTWKQPAPWGPAAT